MDPNRQPDNQSNQQPPIAQSTPPVAPPAPQPSGAPAQPPIVKKANLLWEPTNLDPASVKPFQQIWALVISFIFAPIGPVIYLLLNKNVYAIKKGTVLVMGKKYRKLLLAMMVVFLIAGVVRIITDIT